MLHPKRSFQRVFRHIYKIDKRPVNTSWPAAAGIPHDELISFMGVKTPAKACRQTIVFVEIFPDRLY
jgi:hypothetical protein